MRVLLWPLRLIGFAVWFFGQVIRSNTRVTYDILTAHDVSSPLVLRMRTNCRTEVEVALLATLISLTPGTLVLAMNRDPSDGTRTLFATPCTTNERRSWPVSANSNENAAGDLSEGGVGVIGLVIGILIIGCVIVMVGYRMLVG